MNEEDYFLKRHNQICTTFDTLRKLFPDDLTESGEYKINGGHYRTYFPKLGYTDVDKINGYFLWLFNSILYSIYVCGSKESCITVVFVYILGWLSYKLNQKTENGITKLMDFYTMYIENGEEYKKSIENGAKYKTYIELINKKKDLMNVNISVMSKFYDALIICEYLKYVNNFVDNYNTLFSYTNDNLFKQALSVASNDYYHIKRTLDVDFVREQFPELTKETTATQISTTPKKSQMGDASSGKSESSSDTKVSISDSTSPSSSLVNKLISIPFIFVVISILLGIAYKWESINTIDKYFDDDSKNPDEYNSRDLLKFYCPDSNCSSDELKIISGFIMLLNLIGEEEIDGEKLVEYAILWLSYKLNQKKENETIILKDFYTDHIEYNSCYKGNIPTDSNSNINKDVIEKKIDMMNMDIKDISNFYDPFKSLCNMYSELDPKKTQCKTCLENAGEFFEKYEKLKNTFDITKGDSYSQLWSNLSVDYKIFQEKYNSFKCDNVSSVVACPRSSVTKNTLISIAIIFIASSILLGVSYKYSLFGFRKRPQKQHLREMLKK
ncbi:hypothetical protein YYC_05537 [Plasmodium yoelii 17X]|uniref:YIR protein n=1 Tax=Plasmodium yoelii 17X TaxID=1323249 RepID=V7PDR4_PLAYE|nr:hypothetical protein YYC_05537 [Plasmodium yoelii 17X]